MTTRRLSVWPLLTLAAASLACAQLSGNAATPAATPAATSGSEATAASAATDAPAGPTATPGVEPTLGPLDVDASYGPGDFNLPDPALGLDTLASYQTTLTVSFSGEVDGTPQQWTETYTLLVQRDPAVRQLTVTSDDPAAAPLFRAEQEGVAYAKQGDGPCTAQVLDPAASDLDRLVPVRLLPAVIGAEAAGSETVNGLAADHYTFDERAVGQVLLTVSTGELWVATDGGYLVQYTLTSQGGAEYLGPGREGRLTQTYALTTPAAAPAALPEDCPPGLVNAPVLPDAANVASRPGVLSYTSSTPLADAAAFYNAQLPGLGWAALGDPALTATNSLQDFTQGAEQLTVLLTQTDTGLSVQLIRLKPVPLTGP